jgi:hypothetical protein
MLTVLITSSIWNELSGPQLLNDDIGHMPLISYKLHISDSPHGCQLPGLIGAFSFSYDFYDRQAFGAGWHDCDGSPFLQLEYPIKRFVIATLQDFLMED